MKLDHRTLSPAPRTTTACPWRRVSASLVTAAALVALAPSPRAQVPEGWAIASAWKQYNYTTGGGGLTVFHPHRSDPRWQVTGLPKDLTGIGVSSPNNLHGATSVLLRPADGRVLVGERTSVPNDVVEIHEITLVKQAALAMRRHRIGTVNKNQPGADVNQMVWLPDGRVLFVYFGVDSPALPATSGLAILDLATSKVTAVPVAGVSGPSRWFALAIDPSGKTAYFSVHKQVTPTTTRIYTVPVPAGGQATLVSTMADHKAAKLAIDNNGELLALMRGSASGLYRLRGSRWVHVDSSLVSIKGGFAVDRTTGSYVARVDSPGVTIERIGATGGRTVVHTLPNGSEVISGIAIMPSMRPYGPETTGAYRWQTAPNPGGVPILGNAKFSLTATTSGSAMPGMIGLGLQAGDQPFLGVRLLIDKIIFVGALPPSTTATLALPIPSIPSLMGMRVYAQTLHTRGASVLASQGLKLTVF